MRTSSLLGWFLIISLLLLSQSLIISCENHESKITPLGRELVEHEESADGSHGHHHDHLRVFVRKSKKKKKKKKSSATRTSNQFTYLSAVVSSFVLVLAAF
uniref:Transmembrane protein n=2 Tax=Noccaea caerulescens TaxID=107243 RepID=A0A1J3I4B5_NOCCA